MEWRVRVVTSKSSLAWRVHDSGGLFWKSIFFGYYRHGYHEHSESNHGAPSQEYFDDSVQCKYGPLMCVARRLLHPKGAPIRSPLDRRGEAPKGSIFSAHGLAWRRRVRIFYARDSRPHQRVQLFGSEWSPHLSRGVSTTDQNSLEPSICKGGLD